MAIMFCHAFIIESTINVLIFPSSNQTPCITNTNKHCCYVEKVLMVQEAMSDYGGIIDYGWIVFTIPKNMILLLFELRK